MNKNEQFVITINRELGSGGKTEEQMAAPGKAVRHHQ